VATDSVTEKNVFLESKDSAKNQSFPMVLEKKRE
jgi:hypothetical protein